MPGVDVVVAGVVDVSFVVVVLNCAHSWLPELEFVGSWHVVHACINQSAFKDARKLGTFLAQMQR